VLRLLPACVALVQLCRLSTGVVVAVCLLVLRALRTGRFVSVRRRLQLQGRLRYRGALQYSMGFVALSSVRRLTPPSSGQPAAAAHVER